MLGTYSAHETLKEVCVCPQVSSLEQHLERARATLQGEVRNRERDGREKDQNLQEMNQQNKQLSESVR